MRHRPAPGWVYRQHRHRGPRKRTTL
jgi:hypothetical protein